MVPYIPERSPDAKFRTLIVLLDGTGDSIDDDVTNIVMLKDMLCGNDDKQMVLYLQGIGSKMDDSWQSWTNRMWDQAFASSFPERVITAYKWLAENYKDGDKICIFGFSRGAYTARVLAGMINGMGLLPMEGINHVEKAYDLYDDFADLDDKDPAKRKHEWHDLEVRWQNFKAEKKCQEVFIEFLGCWDTVNSVGYARAIKLSFTRTNDIVRTFRHAIALDEHRFKFKQNNWSGPPKEVPDSADRPNSKEPRCKTNVEEVWFAGCHCDIGGGSVPNGTRPNLAHISLRWMIRECFRMNSSILFIEKGVKVIGIDPSSIYPIVKPRPEISSFSSGSSDITVVERQTWGDYFYSWVPFTSKPELKTLLVPTQSEEELDAIDALAPAYDQLTLHPGKWSAMEDLKLKKWQPKDGGFVEVNEPHESHGRTIPPHFYSHGGKIKVHRTVQLRMEAKFKNGKEKGQKYVPLARVGYQPKYEDKKTFEQSVNEGWIQWVA
ncbi:hypothetical protein BT96DRAFT_854734 [Gymnopus androsaceus JB14]|uniref:T6SS Phospholipase effector Tle1-like catalytic domain-containing protein n=1 Tax=Gymnopus androsaceus JB14 TaxID=1447944 RepID=A0A6A4I0S2_9AGAR|nr:hypothetical protein BT96DRAFT_854734 [Gymnopus androsaceus JB14]